MPRSPYLWMMHHRPLPFRGRPHVQLELLGALKADTDFVVASVGYDMLSLERLLATRLPFQSLSENPFVVGQAVRAVLDGASTVTGEVVSWSYYTKLNRNYQPASGPHVAMRVGWLPVYVLPTGKRFAVFFFFSIFFCQLDLLSDSLHVDNLQKTNGAEFSLRHCEGVCKGVEEAEWEYFFQLFGDEQGSQCPKPKCK